MKYPKHIVSLIAALRRLPGVGNKTAERYAFQMLGWQSHHLAELAASIGSLKEMSSFCQECGALYEEKRCPYCREERRDRSLLCVVSTIKELFAIEQMGEHKGLYHVLGGLLSSMDGIICDSLAIDSLKTRIAKLGVEEVVIALDSTLEGDATTLYLRELLAEQRVTVTRLAFGLPMGRSFDYIGGGTLAMALSGRRAMR